MQEPSRHRKLKRMLHELHPYQYNIVCEARQLQKGALCLPMGSGKTMLSLLICSIDCHDAPFLVVCAKSLLASWETELAKFFGPDSAAPLTYRKWLKACDVGPVPPGVNLILTTPDVVGIVYKKLNIERLFVETVRLQINDTNLKNDNLLYHRLNRPILDDDGNRDPMSELYRREWAAAVVDEAHMYMNIRTRCCRSLACLWSTRTWLLSGTLFDEPHATKVMGFLYLLHVPDAPQTLADVKKACGRAANSGVSVRPHCVIRRDNAMWVNRPQLVETVMCHCMTAQEELLYLELKRAIQDLGRRIQEARRANQDVRNLSSTMLGMMTYLRQCLVVPLSLVSNIVLVSALEDDDSIRPIMTEVCRQMHRNLRGRLDLDDESNMLSTRVSVVLSLLRERHDRQRVLVYSSFQCLLNVVEHFIHQQLPDRRVVRLRGDMSAEARREALQQFEEREDAVALVTFKLGGTGLNLQSASVCVVMDFWWNSGMTRQAMSRVMRFGQTRDVSVYYLTSNTAFERELFNMHGVKRDKCERILNEQEVVGLRKKTTMLGFDKITQLVNIQDNIRQLQNVHADARLVDLVVQDDLGPQ